MHHKYGYTLQTKHKAITWRTFFSLRYRLYVILIVVVLLPVLYASTNTAPPTADSPSREVIGGNVLARFIGQRDPLDIPKPLNIATAVPVSINPDDLPDIEITPEEPTKVVYYDPAGEELDRNLNFPGFLSSEPFKDLGLNITPISDKPAGLQVVEVPESAVINTPQERLEDIIPCPAAPINVNLLSYPKYNVIAPVIYTGMDDLFVKRETGEIEQLSGEDLNAPIQQKLRDGVIHVGFSVHPGEPGNAYIVGHSSNYSSVISSYNNIFKPLERRTEVGEEFIIWDRCGRELRFRNFENKVINEDEANEAYRGFENEDGSLRRVVTLQTSVLELTPNGWLPTKRWLMRGELIQ